MADVESWNVTPNNGVDLRTLPPDMFIIQFELHRVLRSLRLRPTPDGSFFREEVVSCFAPHITTSLQLRRDLLLSETDSVLAFQEISDKLGSLNIPRPTIHSSIIEQIYLIAERLASESWKNCRRIRPILVEIGVALSNVNQDINDELIITDVDDWFFVEEGVPVYKGASRSSIQELEKTTAGLSLKESSCSVCLEEFVVESQQHNNHLSSLIMISLLRSPTSDKSPDHPDYNPKASLWVKGEPSDINTAEGPSLADVGLLNTPPHIGGHRLTVRAAMLGTPVNPGTSSDTMINHWTTWIITQKPAYGLKVSPVI
ncbi:hypothetical protein LguiB_021731 [Lonicera macranthoides]